MFSFFHDALAYLGLGAYATGAGVQKQLDAIFAQAISQNPTLWAKSSAHAPTRQEKFERFALFFAKHLATTPLTPTQRRALLEAAIVRLEIGLREAGVGDMGVSKEIRTLAAALNGRIQSYEKLFTNNNKRELIKASEQHNIPPNEAENAWGDMPTPTAQKAKATRSSTRASFAPRKKPMKKHLRPYAKTGIRPK